jgi:uncharacterized membrane protein
LPDAQEADVTYMTLIKHTVHEVPAAKLLEGDVIATGGSVDEPKYLRRIDVVSSEAGKVELLVSTPKTGKDESTVTYEPKASVIVVGRVEEQVAAEPKAPKAKGAAKQRATAKNPAPVKVTVDAKLQTTPPEAKPAPRPAPKRQPKAETTTFADKLAAKLADKLGSKLDSLVESAIDAALDAAIVRVLG